MRAKYSILQAENRGVENWWGADWEAGRSSGLRLELPRHRLSFGFLVGEDDIRCAAQCGS